MGTLCTNRRRCRPPRQLCSSSKVRQRHNFFPLWKLPLLRRYCTYPSISFLPVFFRKKKSSLTGRHFFLHSFSIQHQSTPGLFFFCLISINILLHQSITLLTFFQSTTFFSLDFIYLNFFFTLLLLQLIACHYHCHHRLDLIPRKIVVMLFCAGFHCL